MFQRFKSAIDRTIAEEQARQNEQRNLSPSGNRQRSLSRSNSAKDSPAKRRTKKPGQDAANGDNLPNTDPAVFEAAFALDEEEAEAKATAEQPQAGSEKNGSTEGLSVEKKSTEDDDQATLCDDQVTEKTKDASAGSNEKGGKPDPSSAPAELPAEVKTRLRKLEKLEKTYPGMWCPYNDTCPCLLEEIQD